MAEPLKCLLLQAGMLQSSPEDSISEPNHLGSREVWYLPHGDFRTDNPDGLAMREIGLPYVSLGSQDVSC
jgi:hypothetical protein